MIDARTDIIETIYRFANGLDLKDWQMVRDCFTETIATDYGDLRGDVESYISADDYVAKRQVALSPLQTQHLSSNHIIKIDGDTAICQSQMLIYRKKDNTFFNTHCFYEHHLVKRDNQWKISAVKQRVWWSEGDATIHSGAK